VTAVQILHGSANAIGGQSAVIKLRAGSDPSGLLFRQAPPGIKFALGENVTQKSWGERFNKRYPQTRMGVEEFFRERFDAALDYERKWKEYQALPSGKRERTIPPRRDLELETLGQVIRGQRLVHCHAYRGDEMLAVMRVAEAYGFHIASFEHALEAYKVAPEMAAHGAGACLASDWWAYKPEAYDAIPYNAALLHAAGVTVDFCSDSPELARRLNLEAAKAVKYGGVPEEEALCMVTRNPAAILGVDRLVGTLESGKDADLAVWSGSPLSTGSICLQTWIEGRKYFDREADLAARPARDAERAALLAKAKRAAEAKKEAEKKEEKEGKDRTEGGKKPGGTDRPQRGAE
jgi:imidazolonepropionase-like amidohydrolase